MSATADRNLKHVNPAAAENRSAAGQTKRHPLNDLVEYAMEYSREKPDIAALWCLGIGFVLGWKLKPW